MHWRLANLGLCYRVCTDNDTCIHHPYAPSQKHRPQFRSIPFSDVDFEADSWKTYIQVANVRRYDPAPPAIG